MIQATPLKKEQHRTITLELLPSTYIFHKQNQVESLHKVHPMKQVFSIWSDMGNEEPTGSIAAF